MTKHHQLYLTSILLITSALARADEGMWLFSAPPRAQIKEQYGFEITDTWLDHLMKSSVRFGGASGSFVSADGLVITNHHVGRSQLQQLSTAERNYTRDGFHARTLAEELKCPSLELNVLQSIEDVTARVNAGVPSGTDGDAASAARRKVIAGIEKESREATGLRSDMVVLYQGGLYHLYRYKRYTDVRLVFAPESAIAAFGGDPDNFDYPRYCLDVCFFRIYENGRPARPTHFLKWSAAGARDGELVFVSGHPGSTDRLFTLAEVEFKRDVQSPLTLESLHRNEVILTAWGARSVENGRRAGNFLLGVQNSRKARHGEYAALQDPKFIDRKRASEESLRRELSARKETAALAAFDQIAQAKRVMAADYLRHLLLEGGAAFSSQSFSIARDLLRAGDERPKPNGERIPTYADARRESFELSLYSPSPIYEDLEFVRLSSSLSAFAEKLGLNDPAVQAVLAGRSPRDRAVELIKGTRVREVAFRRQLYEGGASAVAAAKDPMIEAARAIDSEARSLRKKRDAQEETIRQAHAAIAKARFALRGTSEYPDATGTLRLSYGAVYGYEEEGRQVPSLSTYLGLFERAAAQQLREPFDLPKPWLERQNKVTLSVPFNFVCTADIIGGNSGSPVVNRAGQFVGIVFDGNIQSLSASIAYSDLQARAVNVHSSGIMEALRKVYEAKALADELVEGKLARQ